MIQRITGLLTTLAFTAQLTAQKTGRNETLTATQCIEQYRFDEAQELLDKQIAVLRRRRQNTTAEEQMKALAAKASHMMNATERVTVVDSFVVNKNTFLNTIRISRDNGQLFTFEQFFNGKEYTGCTVYLSELGNKIHFAAPDAAGCPHLYSSDLIDRSWTAPQPLEGLDENNNEAQNFPFMLSDGVTLYYAAQNDESLGGYDIFVSRYDTDSKTFLRPENIGMPFNSMFNDYMYAIDEVNRLGWFVSDRFQPADKVCVYVFVPNDIRQVYDKEDIGEDRLRNLARLTSITETWTDSEMLQNARDRLAQAGLNEENSGVAKDFELVINDRTIYTQMEDFRSTAARTMASSWKDASENWQKDNRQLQMLRNLYATADPQRKKQLERQIRTMETTLEQSATRLRDTEKKIRNEENLFLNKK
ncbi:MAG: proteasome maturation protein [Clostridium sp.]|nr:proteasome maturation protein [Clostridium sp.]